MDCPNCGSCGYEVIKVVDQLLPNEVPILGTVGYVHIIGSLMLCLSCETKFLVCRECDAVVEVPKEE